MKTKILAILIAEILFRTVLFLSLTCIGFFANFCNLHCIYSLSYSSLSLLLSLALPSLPISAILIAQTLFLILAHSALSQLACAKRSAEENGHTYPNLSELQRKRAQSKEKAIATTNGSGSSIQKQQARESTCKVQQVSALCLCVCGNE